MVTDLIQIIQRNLLTEREWNIYLHLNGNRLRTVHPAGSIKPLLDRCNCRRNKRRVTGYQMEFAHFW